MKKDKCTRYVFVRLSENDYQGLLDITGNKRMMPKLIREGVSKVLENKCFK